MGAEIGPLYLYSILYWQLCFFWEQLLFELFHSWRIRSTSENNCLQKHVDMTYFESSNWYFFLSAVISWIYVLSQAFDIESPQKDKLLSLEFHLFLSYSPFFLFCLVVFFLVLVHHYKHTVFTCANLARILVVLHHCLQLFWRIFLN